MHEAIEENLHSNVHVSQGKQWVRNLLALGRFEGFQKKNITPYIHCMVYYIPHQIRQYGSLLQFSGQGM